MLRSAATVVGLRFGVWRISLGLKPKVLHRGCELCQPARDPGEQAWHSEQCEAQQSEKDDDR